MKVTAYIQFSDDPFKNLVQFDANLLQIDGKNGTILIYTSVYITGLESQLAQDREGIVYEFNVDQIVDFSMVDILHSDSVKPERKPYTKKEVFPHAASAPKTIKLKTVASIKAATSKKAAEKAAEVTVIKETKAVEGTVSKKEIKAGSGSFPVEIVLKNLRAQAVISNRASGTIAAIARKLGLLDDWHTFLGLMTRSEWLKQDAVSDGIMATLESLYKKSSIEFKD